MPVYEADFLGPPVPIKSKKQRKPKDAAPEETTPPVLEKPAKKTRAKKAVVSEESVEPVLEKKTPKRKRQEPTPSESTEGGDMDKPKPKRTRPSKPQPSEQIIEEAKDEVINDPATIKKVNKLAEKKSKLSTTKKIIDGAVAEEPPSWFKAWCLDQKKRENNEKPKKEKIAQPELKKEATALANEKWSDGLTRDRVRSEVDNHMGKLYSMVIQ